MSYSLISGVRQDHKGRLYQLATYPNGKVIEVPYSETMQYSPATARALTPVRVESNSRPGVMYDSLQCFQGASV